MPRARKDGISRRSLLGGAAAAGGGLALAGLAGPTQAQAPTPKRPLQVLSTEQAALIGAMADRVFPADDDSPGATDIGVVAYLDGQLAGAWGDGARFFADGPIREATDYGHGYQLGLTPLELYRHVLPIIDRESTRRYGKSFADAQPGQQDELMHALEDGKVDVDLGDGDFAYTSADFFTDFLGNVKEGLFADPMYHGNRDVEGWKWIDYPGDPMAYGDVYWAVFGRKDDAYSVPPKGMR